MAKFSSASIIVSIGRKADTAELSSFDYDDFRRAEAEFCSALAGGRIDVRAVELCLPYVWRYGRTNLAMIMAKGDWRWLAIQISPDCQAYRLALRLAEKAPKYLPGAIVERARHGKMARR